MTAYEEHRKRIEEYAKQLKKSQSRFINKACSLALYVDHDADEYFYFAKYPELTAQVKGLEKLIHDSVYGDITSGMTMEWRKALKYCDVLARDMYRGLKKKAAQATYEHRVTALNAFIKRTQDGMNLSDRVWNLTPAYKQELEAAISLALGKGTSAVTLSKQVSKYLSNYEELKKDYTEKFGKATLPKNCEYASMRLARTEINMAYKTAEQTRWQDMDFVIGYEVKVSRVHTEEDYDICDELQGKYPKTFKFKSWHPNCRCMCLPITMKDEEFEKYLNGEEVEPKEEVKELPQNFTDWYKANEDRVNHAKTLPYFIRDNQMMIADAVKPKQKPMTALEVAELRHKNRTPEQIKEIQGKWDARTCGNFSEFFMYNSPTKYKDVDFAALLDDYHNKDYKKLYFDLQNAKKQYKVAEAFAQTLTDTMPLSDVKAFMEDYSAQEVLSAINSAKKKIEDFNVYATAHSSDELGYLKAMHKKLKFEAFDYLEGNMNGVQSKYPTWKVSQKVFTQKLSEVNNKMLTTSLKGEYDALKGYSTKSKIFLDGLDKLHTALYVDKDPIKAQSIIAQLNAKKDELEAAKVKRANAKVLGKAEAEKGLVYTKVEDVPDIQNFTMPSYYQKYGSTGANNASLYTDKSVYLRDVKDAALWNKTRAETDAHLRPTLDRIWGTLTREQKEALYEYTYTYNHVNEPLRGLTYYGDASHAKRGQDVIKLMTEAIDRSSYDTDMWLQRYDGFGGFARFGLRGGATEKDIYDLVGKEGFEGSFMSAGSTKGTGLFDYGKTEILFNIYAPKGTKMIYAEPFSAFGHCAKGASYKVGQTQSTFGGEFETIIQRGTRMRCTRVTRGEHRGKQIWFVDVEIIGQV